MKYKITESGFPTVTISKIRKGENFYAERNACIASSPIWSPDNPSGKMKRRRFMATEMAGTDYSHKKMKTRVGQFVSDASLNVKETVDRDNAGEAAYVLYESLDDGQKLTFKTCFPGTILPWNATPLADDECHILAGGTSKSVYGKNRVNRPHGVLLAVKGSFLVASTKVKTSVYHTKKQSIIQFSETKDAFQRFEGKGHVFLEVHGDIHEIPLYPNEAVDVFPGYLLAFTEGIELDMKPAGDVNLRNEENNDYVIRLTAGEKGGYVYIHSVKPKEFSRKVGVK